MKQEPGFRQIRERTVSPTIEDAMRARPLLFSEQRLRPTAAVPGGMSVDALRIRTLELTLGLVVSVGHEVELRDDERFTLLIPLSGRIDMAIRGEEHRFGAGNLGIALPGARRTRVVAPRGGVFRAVTLQLPSDRPQPARLSDPVRALPDSPRGLLLPDLAMARHVARILPMLAEDVFRHPDRTLPERVLQDLNALIEDLLCDISTAGNAPPAASPALREFRRVCRAMDIIQSRSDDPLSILDLSGELDISPRTLQLAFQSVHGITPRQYLETVRLQRVRQRLIARRPGDSITAIALDCGFMHLGRFTQAYRRAYGERPSETLARQRG